ncbi:MAG: outer membrane protein [Hyphomicrobiales bacterium]
MGAEAAYAFDRNWSAFLEYNYMDFRSDRLDLACNPAFAYVNGVIPLDITRHTNVIKAGINYRFN